MASPKSTGGGGFVFEDKACAWLMACMLTGRFPFAAELGKVQSLAFQTIADGWLLDDVLVTTPSHRVAFSIRSNTQFRKGPKAPQDFVLLAWKQFLGGKPKQFDPQRDRLGLVTAKLPPVTHRALDTLISRAARNDPATLRARVQTRGWTNKAVRTLFSSFECPSEIQNSTAVEQADTARLLSCLVFREHDFEAVDSESARRAIEVCRNALRFGDDAAAINLWESLCTIAADHRPHAGTLTRLGLIRRLLPRYRLAEYPDHAPDWVRLQDYSETMSSGVRTSLADHFCLNRAEELARVETALSAAPHVVLIGESGSGKSALARQLFTRHLSRGGKALWIDASLERPDLASLQRDLNLSFPLRELMLGGVDPEPLLVIDGLDRPLENKAFRLANDLLSLATDEAAATDWRVVVPCSVLEWPRVQAELRRAGAASVRWGEHAIEPLRVIHWLRVLEHTRLLTKALRDRGLRKTLENLKLLDVVLRHLLDSGNDNESAEHWLHELNVAEAFWSSAIDQGPDRFGRGRLVRELAQLQADRIVWQVPVDALSSDAAIASLISDGIVASTGTDALAFQHELYADWARVRILSQQSPGLGDFVGTRLQSPLWHRALRLLGAQLLDADYSAEKWRSVFRSLDAGNLVVARDLLIEGAIFSRDPHTALEAIKTELLAGEGNYLRRLLGRFVVIATLPHPLLDEYARILNKAPERLQAEIRVPYWPMWPGVLDFLHSNRATVAEIAAWRLADVVSVYQRSAPPQLVYREKVADLALCLAEYALQTQDVHGGEDWYAARHSFYRCLLQAVPERPDAARPLLLCACQRGPLPPDLSVKIPGSDKFARARSRGLSKKQWPAGPGDHIDESFGQVVLDRSSIIPLFIARPELAQEVLLACLIRPRFQQESWSFIMPLEELRDLNKWFPRSYEHGPFLALLRTNFAHALRIIASLVSFATDRYCERVELSTEQAQSAKEPEGTNSDVGGMLETGLDLPTGVHRYRGNDVVYGWSAGGHAPNAVAAALMALEKHFYDQFAGGADVSRDLSSVLTETSSVAFLKVLCEVGKMRRELFDEVLLPLLGCPELYLWDRTVVDRGRVRLADLLPEFAEPQRSDELQAFRALEHRKQTLLDVAKRAMLFRPSATAFFEQACRRWANELPNSSPLRRPLLEELLLMLDRNNYVKETEKAYRNVALEGLQSRQQHDVAELEQRALRSYFPLRSRKLLDDETVLSQSDLDTHWQLWTQIRERWNQAIGPQDGGSAAPEALLSPLVAGVALLLRQPDWIDGHQEQAGECIRALEEVLTQAAFDGREDWGFPDALAWSYFAAEALSAIWALREPHPRLLPLTGLLILKGSQLAATRLFIGLSYSRSSKPDEFEAMRALAIEWAHVRPAAAALASRAVRAGNDTSAAPVRLEESIDAWTRSRLDDLGKGSCPKVRVDWRLSSEWKPNEEAEAWLRKSRWTPGPDLDFITSVHSWMPTLSDAISHEERESWVSFLKGGLGVVLAELNHKFRNMRDHTWPDASELWFLRRLGIAVLDMTAVERPAEVWQPLLALPNRGEEWVCAFLRAFHRAALSRSELPDQYTPLIQAFVADALTENPNRERWGYGNGTWDAVIGIQGAVRFDEGKPSPRDAWSERHRVALETLGPVFDVWMNAVPISAARFQTVTLWLQRPATVPVRLRFLPWLLSSILTYESHEMPDSYEPSDSVAGLLNVVWQEQEYELRSSPVIFSSFQALLTWCAGLRVAAALDLQTRIATRGT